jgi:hypothetical protein
MKFIQIFPRIYNIEENMNVSVAASGERQKNPFEYIGVCSVD